MPLPCKSISKSFSLSILSLSLSLEFWYSLGQILLFRVDACMWTIVPKCTCDKEVTPFFALNAIRYHTSESNSYSKTTSFHFVKLFVIMTHHWQVIFPLIEGVSWERPGLLQRPEMAWPEILRPNRRRSSSTNLFSQNSLFILPFPCVLRAFSRGLSVRELRTQK